MFPVFGAAMVFFVLPGRLGIFPTCQAMRRIARRSSTCANSPDTVRRGSLNMESMESGKKPALYGCMDPFLEFQRGLLSSVFVYWGIAIALAASMKFLVRNAEAWKTRLVEALFPESSEPFAEQALLPLDFHPCCPNCQGPTVERRARNPKNGSALFWECAAFSSCDGTRIQTRNVHRSYERPRGCGVRSSLSTAFDVSVVWTSVGQLS
jgi:hypothetical protein